MGAFDDGSSTRVEKQPVAFDARRGSLFSRPASSGIATPSTTGVEVIEKRENEHKAVEDKKRKDEVDFLKYQGQHLDAFLRQLGPVGGK